MREAAVGTPGGEHDLLGKGLGALDHGGRPSRAEASDARGGEGVGYAGHERHLWPDDDQVGGDLAGQRRDGVRIGERDIVLLRVPRDAWVARRGVQFGHVAVRGQGTGQRVLAAA